METNITKGEWFVSNDNQIVSMPSQCKITNRVSGWNPEEAKANAKLISAAPELLEALIKMCDFHEKNATWDKGNNGYYEAKQIIKKATE